MGPLHSEMTSGLACPSDGLEIWAPCPLPKPREFREDVVRVPRACEDGITLTQIARYFGVHEITPNKWLRQADVEDGNRAGRTREESSELPAARLRTCPR